MWKWKFSGWVLIGLALACGAPACIPLSDDASGTGQAGDAGRDGRIPGPLSDFGSDSASGSDSAGGGGGSGSGSDWDAWGTTGSVDGLEKSPDGYALCALSDIRTDDLRGFDDTEVPDGPWSALPVPDETLGRCGDDDETALWRLANCERLTRELDPLTCDLRLVWVSRYHSQDMVDRGYFDHEDPDGKLPWDRLDDRGIRYSWLAENIANYPDAESAHLGWMDSEGHRSNILSTEMSYMGVGGVPGGFGRMYTQSFIHP